MASEIDRLDEDPMGGPPIKTYCGGHSLHTQSHGESFMALLSKRLKGPGLYIFDEPEAALSPSRQMAALVRIHDLVKKGAQFIIATHSLAPRTSASKGYVELCHVWIARPFDLTLWWG